MAISEKLHRAVGQLITGKVIGYELDDQTEKLISTGTMRGVTLFKDNARDLPQLIQLMDRLIKVGGNDFLITVDQEGGAVQRFDHVLTPLPSAMALGTLADDADLRAIMSVSGQQMRLLGVNCVLAPVLDINSNRHNPIIGTRSFGSDRDVVVKKGIAVAEAYITEGILPVGKHYPGHGDTFQDSHLKLAVVDADQEMLEERELYPFRNCASHLPSILVGHVWLTAFDKDGLPASLSPRVTQQLLREEIGYDGFLMSDDMPVMKAIMDYWGLQEAAIRCINAGLDNLLISGTVEQITAVHKALCDAVANGEITEHSILSALRRRDKALSFCRDDRPKSFEERQAQLEASIQAGNKLAAEIAGRCVSTLRGQLPNPVIESDEWVLVVPNHPRYRLDLLTPLSERLHPGAAALRERRYAVNPTPDEIEDVVTFAQGKKCILVTFRALLNEGQMDLARKLAQKTAGGILVASDVPYEADDLPEWKNAVATFDPSDLAMSALVSLLTAKSSPISA